jgi:hypothetical protein
MDIYKCPKWKNIRQTQNRFFLQNNNKRKE